MSDEYQWRQLGSIVNAVLMQTKTQAIRKGSLSRTAPQPSSRVFNVRSLESGVRQRDFEPRMTAGRDSAFRAHVGDLPSQLELPFGIQPTVPREAAFAAPRSPRGMRLM